MSSILIKHPNAALADVVIAVVWRTIESSSILLGSTKFKENQNGAIVVLLMVVALLVIIEKNMPR